MIAHTLFIILVAVVVCGLSNAFVPTFTTTRSTSLYMSHFSTVKTQLKDKSLLVSSLRDLNVNVKEYDTPQTVRGWRGETSQAEIVIEQENGQDIGFNFNGESYEMVADLEFWGQKVPMEVFLEKLNQRYSFNVIMESAAASGFTTETLVESKVDNTIKISMSRYDA